MRSHFSRARLSRRSAALTFVFVAAITAASTGTSRASAPDPSQPTLTVTAARDELAVRHGSPVAHATETMALTPHAGRLFAATDKWMYDGPDPTGAILTKDSATGPWRVFEHTQSLRVEALRSFPIPTDQGVGNGHALLVTQAITNSRSRIQWLMDATDAFPPRNSYVLPSRSAHVRAFGAHQDGGVWSIYAGVEPTGILRGVWSPRTHTLEFDPTPELVAPAPATAGAKTQKVTGFADCGAALYATINTRLYRRNDGQLSPGVPRWALVYEAPAVGTFNSGLRGLSCVGHGPSSALVVSTEGTGDILRIDDLPDGQLAGDAAPLTPELEFEPVDAIRRMLATAGTNVPTSGAGSIGYVIAAYNDFAAIELDGVPHQLFGFEWGYRGGCPPTRRCGPTAFGTIVFDAAACFGVRTTGRSRAGYELRCLGGPDLTPRGSTGPPVRRGDAFVAARTIARSPFDDGQVYFGGYDCNFFPADGTAWVAHAPLAALDLGGRTPKERA